MLLGTSLLFVFLHKSCLPFVMAFFWPLFFIYFPVLKGLRGCTLAICGMSAGICSLVWIYPTQLTWTERTLFYSEATGSRQCFSREKWESFMGFVKRSWKRKRNVRRLEKGINNITIHSNKLKRKLLDSDFFIIEIRFSSQ